MSKKKSEKKSVNAAAVAEKTQAARVASDVTITPNGIPVLAHVAPSTRIDGDNEIAGWKANAPGIAGTSAYFNETQEGALAALTIALSKKLLTPEKTKPEDIAAEGLVERATPKKKAETTVAMGDVPSTEASEGIRAIVTTKKKAKAKPAPEPKTETPESTHKSETKTSDDPEAALAAMKREKNMKKSAPKKTKPATAPKAKTSKPDAEKKKGAKPRTDDMRRGPDLDRAKILSLRKAGKTWDEIAKQLNTTHHTAWRVGMNYKKKTAGAPAKRSNTKK